MSLRKLTPAIPVARLHLKVLPGASREGCAGIYGDRLKIRLRAPAVDGKANEALLAFLAGELGLPGRCLAIVAGEKSREKTVEITGMDPVALAAWQNKVEAAAT